LFLRQGCFKNLKTKDDLQDKSSPAQISFVNTRTELLSIILWVRVRYQWCDHNLTSSFFVVKHPNPKNNALKISWIINLICFVYIRLRIHYAEVFMRSSFWVSLCWISLCWDLYEVFMLSVIMLGFVTPARSLLEQQIFKCSRGI